MHVTPRATAVDLIVHQASRGVDAWYLPSTRDPRACSTIRGSDADSVHDGIGGLSRHSDRPEGARRNLAAPVELLADSSGRAPYRPRTRGIRSFPTTSGTGPGRYRGFAADC